MSLALSRFSMFVGVLCLFFNFYLYWLRSNPNKLAFFLYKPRTVHAQQANGPSRIIINKLGINLPIVPASVKDSRWEVSEEGVSYLTSSPLPGQKGNSVLYGHNWAELLGKLPQIQPGDTFEIVFSDKSIRKFRVENTGVVTPDQVHILSPSKDARVTLYTCTGFLDTKRFVATALLVK